MSIHECGGAKAAPKPLFTTRRPTTQWAPWRIGGWTLVAIGLITATTDLLNGVADRNPYSPFFSVFFICGLGWLIALCGRGLRLSRIEGYDQHLSVRVALRKPRTVAASDIALIGTEVHSQGASMNTFTSTVGRDARRRKLFRAFTSYRDYDALLNWLETRCPDAWAEHAAEGTTK